MAINMKNLSMMSQDDIAYVRSRQTQDFRQKKFIEFLSPEAQQAMTETIEEMSETGRREKEFKDRSLDDITEETESRAGSSKSRNENLKSGKRKRGESQEGVVLSGNGKLKSDTKNDSVDIIIDINLNEKDDDTEKAKSTEQKVDDDNEANIDEKDKSEQSNQDTKEADNISLKTENNGDDSENIVSQVEGEKGEVKDNTGDSENNTGNDENNTQSIANVKDSETIVEETATEPNDQMEEDNSEENKESPTGENDAEPKNDNTKDTVAE
ncbi:unnamed protein product [Owenia fusiformis]|uniref:Uncharacterized protein n=1 Tax=Owenia fusiformis TaxID=6347 RepID=A0A8J1TGY0_OWEFU|nr:unnamed protein product [Owenia fusiformis]